MRDIRAWVMPSKGKPTKKHIWEDWEMEGQFALYRLCQDLSHFDLGWPKPEWWPSWDIPANAGQDFAPGFHHDDTDTPVAGVAAGVWLIEHASTLFSEVARVLERAGLRQTLEPTRLAEKLLQILRHHSMGMPSAVRLELLAHFMVSVGIDVVPVDADWRSLLRRFVEHEVSTCDYVYLRPLLRWAVEVELGPEDTTLEDRRRSYANLVRKAKCKWDATLLNNTADLLLMLELWRPATPIIEHSIALEPSGDAAMDTYGWALFFERDYVGAECQLKKSLDLKEQLLDLVEESDPEHEHWCVVQHHRLQVALWSHRLSDARIIIGDMQATAPHNRHTIQATKLKALLSEASTMNTNVSQANSEYDVALSFAGEDRWYADQIARSLVERGITVFYDDFERAALWGEDLYQYLSTIYQHRAKFCMIFISAQYAKKRWATLECRAAQARAFHENSSYLLPVRIDDTEIPGIFPTLGYMSWQKDGAELILQTLVQKLERRAAR